jgi:hypothetical protein
MTNIDISQDRKILVANQVLSLIVPNSTQFETQQGKVLVSWITHKNVVIQKVWRTIPHSDSFPSFHHEWAQGGTTCIALCHLARWIQGRNVLPLSAWSKWIANGLGNGKGDLILALLKEAGYPATPNCMRCGQSIYTAFDWYGYGKNSGCAHLKCPEVAQTISLK